MEVSIESLMPFEKIKTDIDGVLSVVEKTGKVVLLKDNRPAYLVIKVDAREEKEPGFDLAEAPAANYTLQEAMRLVLLEADNNTMHASKLADEIFNQRLYIKKNGQKAQYNQIRARCEHYPNLFEALKGNNIRLKNQNEE